MFIDKVFEVPKNILGKDFFLGDVEGKTENGSLAKSVYLFDLLVSEIYKWIPELSEFYLQRHIQKMEH